LLPGLNAAFVNIGTYKSGFLSLDDAIFDLSDLADDETGAKPAFKPQKAALKAGQEIMVQISKEPLGSKGPRLTSYVSFPGRFCVLIPNQGGIGISRKIENREERSRLRKVESAIEDSIRENGEPPDEDKLAEILGMSQGELTRTLDNARP
jgi:ribonuclease G